MALGELEFVIKIREDLNRQLKALEGQIATGASGMGKEFDRAGRSVVGLTGFAREQMREQRIQNFLFREGSQALGAVALGMTAFSSISGNTDASMKRLNNSLQSGFMAFQGISFALQGLGPYASIAVGAMTGLAVAVKDFQNAASGDGIERIKTAVDRFRESVRGANEEQLKLRRTLLETDADRFRAELKKAEEGVTVKIDRAPRGFGSADIEGPTEKIVRDEEKIAFLKERVAATTEKIVAVNKMLPSVYDVINRKTKEGEEAEKKRGEAAKKSINDQISAYQALLDASDALRGRISDEFPLQVKINETVQKRIALYRELGEDEFLRIANRERELQQLQALRSLERVPENRPASMDQGLQDFIQSDPTVRLLDQLGQLGVTADNTNQMIVSSTQSAAAAITDAFFDATQSIEQFFRSMVQNVAQMIIEELLKKFIVGAIGSIVGSVFGGGGASAIGGTISEFGPVSGTPSRAARSNVPNESPAPAPVTVIVQMSGTTAKQSTVRDRQNLSRVLDELIYSEK
jgi:hypothetical protein